MRLDKVKKVDYVEEEHGAFYNYLYTFKTYFLTITSANFLFAVFNIPMMLVAAFLVVAFLPLANPVFIPENFVAALEELGIAGNESINDVGAGAADQLYFIIVVFAVMFFVGSTLLSIGPFQAGFAQIYRNLYRKESVFFFSDFKAGMTKNWKQSLAAMVVSIVGTVVMLFAIVFYHNQGTTFGTAISTLFVVMFLIFIIVQNFVFQQIVSIDIPLKKIYKNSILFFILKFGPCFGLIGVVIVFLLLIPFLLFISTTYFGYAVAVILYMTILLGFVQYTLAYYGQSLIEEYIIPKTLAAEAEDDGEDADDDTDDSEDDSDVDSEDDEEEDSDDDIENDD